MFTTWEERQVIQEPQNFNPDIDTAKFGRSAIEKEKSAKLYDVLAVIG